MSGLAINGTADKVDALQALVPGAEWTLSGENQDITWLSKDKTQPSDSAIASKIAELQDDYDAKAYQRTRATAYEAIAEQLDKLYHDMTAGKLDATGEWHKSVKAVKDANPKP